MDIKKRGDFFGLGTLPAIIVAIIAGIIIIFIGLMVASLFREEGDINVCRLSVLAKAKTKMLGMESPIVKDIKCYTNFIDVEEKGIYKRTRGTEEKRVYSFEGLDDYEIKESIKRTIANEMHDCWYQMGEGKVSPWGTMHLQPKGHCVICSQISFEKDFGELDINDFLLSKNMPQKTETYARFFGYNIRDETSTEAKPVSTKEPISVVFIDAVQAFLGAGSIYHKRLVDISVPLEIEGEDRSIHLGLFNQEDIVEECSQLY